MDLAELVVVGGKIAEVGERLKTLRGERDVLNKEISELEKILMPLVVQHTKIISEVMGTPLPVPAAQQPQGPGGGHVPPRQAAREPGSDLKRRIIEFLDDAEPGLSAADVANALKADPLHVRQIMAEMFQAGK